MTSEVELGKRSVDCVLKAIDLNPLSVQLYDRLTKVYGTLECYDKIEPLYDEALKKYST